MQGWQRLALPIGSSSKTKLNYNISALKTRKLISREPIQYGTINSSLIIFPVQKRKKVQNGGFGKRGVRDERWLERREPDTSRWRFENGSTGRRPEQKIGAHQ